MIVQNCWYVAAWSSELQQSATHAITIAHIPLVVYRTTDGVAHTLVDRCPHRHAPLSLGRVEGDALRCMYHGLKFNKDGTCIEVPDAEIKPDSCRVRSLPTHEQDGWIWVWPGDPAAADLALIPSAHGVDKPNFTMRTSQLDYDAHYMLINDNLTDLSHIDFVHERTLMMATGSAWSKSRPRVIQEDRALLIERWFEGAPAHPGSELLVDNWVTYRYSVPGVFIMDIKIYPAGTAAAENHGPPQSDPIGHRVEQQAVTPISDQATRYFYGTGIDVTKTPKEAIEPIFAVVMAAFAEDRQMIEGQQRIINQTPPETPMAFIPSDKAPFLFRRMIEKLRANEVASAATT